MTIPIIILRGEPGASVSQKRAAAMGMTVQKLPMFGIEPVPWSPPEPSHFDRLLLTSANAVRLAGTGLGDLVALPCWCVGQATARAARAVGLDVERTGNADAAGLLAQTRESCRLLWLAGEQHRALTPPDLVALTILPVYRAVPLPIGPAALSGPAIVLVHSERAARRLAEMAVDRGVLSLVAVSPAVAAALGGGWRAVAWTDTPDDAQMVGIAAKLCHDACSGSERT